jgi:hypothetical protein
MFKCGKIKSHFEKISQNRKNVIFSFEHWNDNQGVYLN